MDAAGAVKFGELIQKLGDAETAVSHGTVPSLMGQQIERVSGLGFTHLHVDHVQGIQAVCESKASDTKRLIALHTSDQFGIPNLHTADQSELLKNSACVQQIELADSVHSSLQFPGTRSLSVRWTYSRQYFIRHSYRKQVMAAVW